MSCGTAKTTKHVSVDCTLSLSLSLYLYLKIEELYTGMIQN